MVVRGGVGSPMGAVLGALWLQGTRWFLPGEWQLLASGAGVLAVLRIMPSGLGGLVLRLRDAWLSRLATNRNLDAPGFTPPGSGLAPEDQGQAELEVPVVAATGDPADPDPGPDPDPDPDSVAAATRFARSVGAQARNACSRAHRSGGLGGEAAR